MDNKIRLTKPQKKERDYLLKRIADEKARTKKDAKGSPHKYVKKTNLALLQLYKEPRFCNNQEFLLDRYSKLERKDTLWLNFFLPVYLTIIPELYSKVYNLSISATTELNSLSNKVSAANMQIYILFWACVIALIVTIVLAIASFVGTIRMIIKSLSRSPTSTIQQNELHIIEEILVKHGILINSK